MLNHLLVVLGLSLFSLGASAQSCLKSVSYSSLCTGGAKAAVGVCLSGVSKSFSSRKCTASGSILSNLESQCSSSGNCVAPPPPSGVNSTIRSKYVSKVVSGNDNNIQFSHSSLDPLECMTTVKQYNLTLSSADSRNSAFLALSAMSQWLSVSLVCASSPTVTTLENFNKIYNYPAGCYVSSFANSSAPAPLMCY